MLLTGAVLLSYQGNTVVLCHAKASWYDGKKSQPKVRLWGPDADQRCTRGLLNKRDVYAREGPEGSLHGCKFVMPRWRQAK